MADVLLSLEGCAENRYFWVQIYNWLQHYTKYWASSLRAVKGDFHSGYQMHSQVSSVPPCPRQSAKSHDGFLSVTLLVIYEKLTEEDLVDSTFKSQMIPSSLTTAHPNYQYFWADYWNLAGYSYTLEFPFLIFLSINRRDKSSCLVN